MKNSLLWAWLCILVCLSFSSKAVDCTTDTVGLCTPTIEQIIEESSIETIEFESGGYTITTETTTTTTTTTASNEDSGDILDGNNDYVVSSKEGDMDIDWGGQGSASMPSGNSTSTMGVSNMGTTFINTIDISELSFDKGGRTNYSIKVEKQDAQDSIYMHITGRDGNTNVFSGTDILSASGTNSGFQSYSGGFDFSGSLTTIIVEVGGRDINLAVGPMFDDVTINVLYNVVNTIVEQTITSVEMFIALNTDAPEEVIDVVEDIFESNNPVESDVGFELEPVEVDEISYESVEIEIAEIEIEEIQVVSLDLPEPEAAEISVVEVEAEIEMEIEMDLETEVEETVEVQPETQEEQPPTEESSTETDVEESKEESEEPQKEEAPKQEKEIVKETPKEKQEKTQESKKTSEKKIAEKKEESSKEKAAKKVLKKIDDKKRYDANSQIKTLVVMQVLGDSKSFFETQQLINDRANFFTDTTLPDAVISDNNIASYLLFGGSNQLMNEMVDSQWQQR